MIDRRRFLFISFGVVAGGAASAAPASDDSSGSDDAIIGRLLEAGDSSLRVDRPSGEAIDVLLSPETKVWRDRPVLRDTLSVGELIVAEGSMDNAASFTAHTVLVQPAVSEGYVASVSSNHLEVDGRSFQLLTSFDWLEVDPRFRSPAGRRAHFRQPQDPDELMVGDCVLVFGWHRPDALVASGGLLLAA